MPVLEGPVSTLLGEVGLGTSVPLHAADKPAPWNEYGVLQGHHRVTTRFPLVASQAVNSNMWACRVATAGTIIVPTRFELRWVQTGNMTAGIRMELGLWKMANFTGITTGNSVQPTPSRKRTSMLPSSLEIRSLTTAGASAGLTGGTGTKDPSPVSTMEAWFFLTLPTAQQPPSYIKEMLDDANGTQQLHFAQNEGFLLISAVAAGATHSSSVTVDFSYAEVLSH